MEKEEKKRRQQDFPNNNHLIMSVLQKKKVSLICCAILFYFSFICPTFCLKLKKVAIDTLSLNMSLMNFRYNEQNQVSDWQ